MFVRFWSCLIVASFFFGPVFLVFVVFLLLFAILLTYLSYTEKSLEIPLKLVEKRRYLVSHHVHRLGPVVIAFGKRLAARAFS